MAIAERHGLYIVEDCAQAFGAEIGGRKVGSFGDMAASVFIQARTLAPMVTGHDNPPETRVFGCDKKSAEPRIKGSYIHDSIGLTAGLMSTGRHLLVKLMR